MKEQGYNPLLLHYFTMMHAKRPNASWVIKELFSISWFFNIIFLTILYIVWVKIADKNETYIMQVVIYYPIGYNKKYINIYKLNV